LKEADMKRKKKSEEPQPVSRRRLMRFLTAAALASPAAAIVAAEQRATPKPTASPKPAAPQPPRAKAIVGVEKITYLPCNGIDALMKGLAKDNEAFANASTNPTAVKELTKQLTEFVKGGMPEYGSMLVRIVKVNRDIGNEEKDAPRGR
jgi:hypothetical protein